MHCVTSKRTLVPAVMLLITAVCGSVIAVDKSAELQSKYKAASTSVKDLSATMVVTSINKGNASEINPAFSDIGQFQKATIYYKNPDKFRANGVAQGMAVAYAVNGNKLQIVVPGLVKRVEDVSTKAGKQRTTLDMGFVTNTIWRDNYVNYLGTEGGSVKLKLDPKKDKTKRYELIWINPSNLRLVKRQRYNSGAILKARYVFEDFINVGKLPIARKAKIYAPDGGFVGSVEYQNLKANTGLTDSFFNLIK